jgi:RNA polymerase sigma-70 factor (ECF subfamily)
VLVGGVILATTIRRRLGLVLEDKGMNKPAAFVKLKAVASAEGSASASERLMRTFNGLRDELVSTLWFMLGNREDAQDTAQEAFLKCWRARDGLDGISDMRAWIFRVGLNAAKDLQRSAWRRRAKLFRGEDAALVARDRAPAQVFEDRETLEKLRQAILALRPDEKEVFLLRQNGDLTYEQIAEIRGSPVGTVKTQMRSALQKLRQQFSAAT